MIIIAKEFISSGFSADDAKSLLSKIDESLEKNAESIEIDFSGVKYFTMLFFNMALTSYLKTMSFEEYNQKFVLKNLSDVGQLTYKYSYDNAVEFYNFDPENQKKIIERTESIM